ncbi:hypothetical protein Apa02nite_070390 [Actinoplanes palleronii]|uniref:MFS transporter n=1 Tax=Actinoplanes palleronii TaxID=113570 RepID=A0ABQ4BKV6_9ACTN|nr:hypothetical protein Apa02nite_070390 [Actinoplanes palleronii]
MASIPLAWWAGMLTITQMIVVALVTGFATVLFDVGNQTFLPEIVPTDQLQSRNSLTSGTHAATQLGGPSLGGVAVQLLGAVPTLLVDVVSYLFSAAVLRTLPERRAEPPAEQRPPMRDLIREGWHYVVRHPIVGPCMWDATATNFVTGAMLALFPYYLVRELHASPGLVGLLLATDGLGTLAGALAGPLGAKTTLLLFGALTALSPVIYLMSPVRTLRDLTDLAAPTAERHQPAL